MCISLTDIDVEDFFDKLGQELITSSCSDRMERAFMCLGGDLKEFLTTLDGVHDVLKYQENGQETEQECEAFICTATKEENLQLDFTTDRPAVAFLLVGSLKAIARILYDTEVEINVIHNGRDQRHFRWARIANIFSRLFLFIGLGIDNVGKAGKTIKWDF